MRSEPCGRYALSDGTLCSTHHGRFEGGWQGPPRCTRWGLAAAPVTDAGLREAAFSALLEWDQTIADGRLVTVALSEPMEAIRAALALAPEARLDVATTDLRARIAALRPWPEGEHLIQALEQYADMVLDGAALSRQAEKG